MRPIRIPHLLAVVSIAVPCSNAASQDATLPDYFGFSGVDVIKIGDDPGPMTSADLNGDGLDDLLVLNNSDSRIDVLYQKQDPVPGAVEAPKRPNELPDHWRYRRENIPLADYGSAMRTLDADGDGDLDIIYASRGRIVFLMQESPEQFKKGRIHKIRQLEAGPASFAITDVVGDDGPDLVSIVDGNVTVWPLEGDDLGKPVTLAAGQKVKGLVPADYDGDGTIDIAGVIPDDAAPVRIWFGQEQAGERMLGAQVIFEMPPITVFEAVQLPGEAASRIAVIERASKRVVIYRLDSEEVENSGNRDASFVVHSFEDPGNRDRAQTVVDLNGDGLEDLIATDTRANAIVVYRQEEGHGLASGESFPTLSEVGYIAAADTDGDAQAEIFVLSEDEGVVGRSTMDGSEIAFPRPMSITEGHTPVSMNLVQLEQGPRLAVIAADKRDYLIDLIQMDGTSESFDLGAMSRAPDTVMPVDADQDGNTDLLLFTRDKPMIMLQAMPPADPADGVVMGEETAPTFTKREKADMGQFGLVAKAASENTTTFDIDGSGREELLIADKNFVRAVRYEADPSDGSSPGWQVVKQINTDAPDASLVSLTTLGRRIIAADKTNNRLVIFEADSDGRWNETEALNVRGFTLGAIYGGRFTGDDQESILAIGQDGFAVIRLGGQRRSLEEVAAWRTDEERRLHYDLAVGDMNADGYTDMASLDAGEQMFEIFTFDGNGDMLHVTNFKIYESKLFSRGEGREYQPTQVLITDLTVDGAHDVVMIVHDRILMYPQ
ncbi:MAG: VCBS repeat-containing protein [Planctomycetota bacterium]|nr:VCBS repeat-containing protein [Planctomycetota bacterium]